MGRNKETKGKEMKCYYANNYMAGQKPNGLYSCLTKENCEMKFDYGNHKFCKKMMENYRKENANSTTE